jgi:hypothetical protein
MSRCFLCQCQKSEVQYLRRGMVCSCLSSFGQEVAVREPMQGAGRANRIGVLINILACRPFFLRKFRSFFLRKFRSDPWFSSTLLACHPFFLRTCRSARWFSLFSEFVSIGSVVLIDIHRMPYVTHRWFSSTLRTQKEIIPRPLPHIMMPITAPPPVLH